MLHILIGLFLATLLVLGWISGNLFVCTFLTLPALGLMFIGLTSGADHTLAAQAALLLLVIWAPGFAQREAHRRREQRAIRQTTTEYEQEITKQLRLEFNRPERLRY